MQPKVSLNSTFDTLAPPSSAVLLAQSRSFDSNLTAANAKVLQHTVFTRIEQSKTPAGRKAVYAAIDVRIAFFLIFHVASNLCSVSLVHFSYRVHVHLTFVCYLSDVVLRQFTMLARELSARISNKYAITISIEFRC